MVLLGNLLSTQMLLHRHRIVCAALDSGIVGNNNALLPFNQSNTSDDASRRCVVVVHIPCGKRTEFYKGSIGIAQKLNAFASQQFVTLAMLGNSFLTTPLLYLLYLMA